jgi:hemerythrin
MTILRIVETHQEDNDMPKVEWNESLSVGVDLIDEQHKGLIQRINAMSIALEEHQGEREVMRTLGFLIDYTDYHFSTEQRHMAATDYPGLEEHQAKHEEFKDTLSRTEQEFREEGSTKILADSIHTLLWNWLVNHIQDVDQRFGRYLAEKGMTISGEM